MSQSAAGCLQGGIGMKAAFTLALILLMAASPNAQQVQEFGLPELHTIKAATLAPSYSCRTEQEVQGGYEQTALFLSSYSDYRNAPDLLFNGACGAEDYFQGSTAGDDMSLIADLGNVPLESVTAHTAFNIRNVHSFDLYSRFAMEAKVEANHTYAVLINKSEVRGLFLFSVVNYVPNKTVDLRYAVEEYQLLNVRAQSEGFDWEARNSAH
jgi:hypothetical protein